MVVFSVLLAMSDKTTIAELLRDAARRFAGAGIRTPRLDAEVLLRHVLGIDRTTLFLRYPDLVDPDALVRFGALVDRRLSGQPVAYLTARREFLGLSLTVTPDVLVPRPETEILVEWAREWLARPSRGQARVVDVGTGSGAIAIGLASLLPGDWTGQIIGVDISPAALSVAESNRDRLRMMGARADGALDRVRFQPGDLLRSVAGPVDLLLANLPYLTPAQVDGNPDLAAEPRLALDGGPDGLSLIRRIIGDLPRVLAPGGATALELDPGQAGTVATLLRLVEPDATVTVLNDLAGLARFVTMERRSGR